jgi:hypothetical protein
MSDTGAGRFVGVFYQMLWLAHPVAKVRLLPAGLVERVSWEVSSLCPKGVS